jgi:hypothetical protein
MYRATSKILPIGVATLFLSGCIGLGSINRQLSGEALAEDIEVAQDPCRDPGKSARIASELYSISAPSPLAAPPATQADFDAGMLAVNQAQLFASTAAITSTASEARALAFVNAALTELAEDREFLSLSSARHVEAVERGPLASAQSQAIAAGAGSNGVVELSRSGWRDSLDSVWNATIDHGWDSATVAALGQLRNANVSSADTIGSMSASQRLAFASLVRRSILYLYFKAYFRNGKILSLSMTSDALKRGLKERLSKTIKDETLRKAVEADIDSVAGDIVELLCKDEEKCLALGVIGETAFVTRGGKSYGFSGVEVTFDPFAEKKLSTNKIDKEAVIADLVRVFFEGLGDSELGVPAVKNSTACQNELLCAEETDADNLAKVESIADRVESGAMALTAIAIRGGWLFSLNNEALAKSIQTGVAVAFRKGAEKAAWSRLKKQCPTLAGQPPYQSVQLRLVR